jgi:hypothetical protein
MRGHVLRCAVAALMVWACPAGAQAPAPAPKTVSPASPDSAGCNTVEKPLSAGGASIVPETGGQQKNWQPPGGEISFTVRSFVQIPADSLVVVCFRWKRSADRQDHFVTVRPTHLDLTDAGRMLRVTVVVPEKLARRRRAFPATANMPDSISCRSPRYAFWCSPKVPTAMPPSPPTCRM